MSSDELRIMLFALSFKQTPPPKEMSESGQNSVSIILGFYQRVVAALRPLTLERNNKRKSPSVCLRQYLAGFDALA